MSEAVIEQPKKPRRKTNYINNKTLYSSMIHYKTEVENSKREDNALPQVPNYIGEAILLICNNLARRPNFSGYSFKQEMVSDGIIDCLSAVDNFNPEKTNNPFAYFTQIAWNAFIRRIQKEKKQTYIKHKNFENSFMMNELWSDAENMQLRANEYSSEVVRSFEEKNKFTKPKKPVKMIGIERFSEINEDSATH